MRRFAAPVTAVVVVVVVVLLLIWINGKPSGNSPGPGIVAAPTRDVSGNSSPTLTPSSTPTAASPTASSTPTTASPTASPSATHRTGQQPTPTTPSALVRTAMAPVQVLNNSTISGLAASVASELRVRHWHVSAVGNYQRITPQTTVYFAAGKRDAAEHLAHEFHQVQRILPDAAAGITGRGLTLIVTRDWP